MLLSDDLNEMLGAVGNTAKVPDRRKKKVWLAPVGRQAREKCQQLFGTGNGEGKLLVNLALTVCFVGGKPHVALGDARQFAIRVGHFSDLPRIKPPGRPFRQRL